MGNTAGGGEYETLRQLNDGSDGVLVFWIKKSGEVEVDGAPLSSKCVDVPRRERKRMGN